MKLGVPNQSAQGERRVALVPETAKKLSARGVETVVEAGAGELAHFPDAAYTDAGATIGSAQDAWGADVVALVRTPTTEDIGQLGSGSGLIGFPPPPPRPDPTPAAAPRRAP